MNDNALDDQGTCLWRETVAGRPPRPALEEERDVEVAVIGAGLVGLTTALFASERGLSTAVVEARTIGSGTSGATTGKFSAINGMRYHRLRRRFGRAGAAAYAMAARSGLERTVHLVERHGIDCGLERVRSHLAVTTDRLARSLEREVAAASEAGLRPIDGWDGEPVALPVRAVVTFRDEVQLHPMAYLYGLADAVLQREGTIHEDSPVLGLARVGRRWSLATPAGRLRADHVIVATRLPVVGDRRLTFARSTPVGASAIAGTYDGSLPRSSMLIVGDQTWSVRASRWPDAQRLVAVGPDVRFPDEDTRTTAAVEAWASAHFPGLGVTHRWFAQDQQPVDDRPLIGRLRDGSVWTATGFGKWGLAAGTYAAQRIVAGIAREPYPASALFEPRRVHIRTALGPLIGANLSVARRWTMGRVDLQRSDGSMLAAGEGRVRRVWGRPVAEARDRSGNLYRLDARCTHLGCPVSWNATESSWDCRCHGARFAVDGTVLEAPATQPLARIDDEGDHDG